MLGLGDFDRVLMINLGLAQQAMYCLMITPFLHFFFCYLMTITFKFGLIGAALSGIITNTIVF